MKRKLLAMSVLSLGLTLTAFAYNQASVPTCCQQKAACCNKTTCCDKAKCCGQASCCDKTSKLACCEGNASGAPKQ